MSVPHLICQYRTLRSARVGRRGSRGPRPSPLPTPPETDAHTLRHIVYRRHRMQGVEWVGRGVSKEEGWQIHRVIGMDHRGAHGVWYLRLVGYGLCCRKHHLLPLRDLSTAHSKAAYAITLPEYRTSPSTARYRSTAHRKAACAISAPHILQHRAIRCRSTARRLTSVTCPCPPPLPSPPRPSTTSHATELRLVAAYPGQYRTVHSRMIPRRFTLVAQNRTVHSDRVGTR
eukprot:2970094-Rhodomonas_salina.1